LHIAEGPNELDLHPFSADSHRNFLAALIAELQKILGVQVRHQIAERTIRRNHFSRHTTIVEPRCLQFQTHQRRHRHLRTHLCPILAARYVRSHGRKNVAPVERRRHLGADHPIRICDFVYALDAVALLHQREQPVIRQHKILPALRLGHNRLARAAHGRIDDHHENRAYRKVRRRAIQETRAIANGKRRHLMREVYDAHVRHDRIHHAPADGNGIVHHAEISHENNRLRIFRSLCTGQRRKR